MKKVARAREEVRVVMRLARKTRSAVMMIVAMRPMIVGIIMKSQYLIIKGIIIGVIDGTITLEEFEKLKPLIRKLHKKLQNERTNK